MIPLSVASYLAAAVEGGGDDRWEDQRDEVRVLVAVALHELPAGRTLRASNFSRTSRAS